MPILIKTQGIVLSSKILPTDDVIYVILTEEKGKMRVYGKGVKKTSSKRRPHLQTGNMISVVLRKSHDTYYLQETTLVSAFSQIKQSSTKLNWLYSLLFMIDRLVPEMEQDQNIYNVLQKFMINLSKQDNGLELFTQGSNQVLSSLGYTSEELPLSDVKEMFTELTNQKLPLSAI